MGLGQRSTGQQKACRQCVGPPHPTRVTLSLETSREARWASGTICGDMATWASSRLSGGQNQSWAPSALCRNLFNGLGMCTFWLCRFHKGNFSMFQKK